MMTALAAVKGYQEKHVVINAWNAVANEIEIIENAKSI